MEDEDDKENFEVRVNCERKPDKYTVQEDTKFEDEDPNDLRDRRRCDELVRLLEFLIDVVDTTLAT